MRGARRAAAALGAMRCGDDAAGARHAEHGDDRRIGQRTEGRQERLAPVAGATARILSAPSPRRSPTTTRPSAASAGPPVKPDTDEAITRAPAGGVAIAASASPTRAVAADSERADMADTS